MFPVLKIMSFSCVMPHNLVDKYKLVEEPVYQSMCHHIPRDLCVNHCETSYHTCNVAFLPFMFPDNYKIKNHLRTLLLGHSLGIWHVSTKFVPCHHG